MADIPAQNFDLYADRLMLFSELRLSHGHALETFHRAKHYATFRMILEQISTGERSNADLALMARNTLKAEKADRPTVKRKSKPLVRIAAG
jgi:hypothetical protein